MGKRRKSACIGFSSMQSTTARVQDSYGRLLWSTANPSSSASHAARRRSPRPARPAVSPPATAPTAVVSGTHGVPSGRVRAHGTSGLWGTRLEEAMANDGAGQVISDWGLAPVGVKNRAIQRAVAADGCRQAGLTEGVDGVRLVHATGGLAGRSRSGALAAPGGGGAGAAWGAD